MISACFNRCALVIALVLGVTLLAICAPVGALAAPPPFALPERAELAKIRSAMIETSRGKLYVELFPESAPWHVANFKYLADQGFYTNRRFHIYEPDYILQAGEAERGTFRYELPPEFGPREHDVGTLGMARRPDLGNPERSSSSTQFHILLRRAAHMDGNYTIFGQVKGGKDVLQQLRRGDVILRVEVYVRED